MIRCDEGEILSAYLDGELSPEEAASLEEHLSLCSECRHALAELRHMKEALMAIPPVEPPSELRGRIMSAVKPENDFPGSGWLRSLWNRQRSPAIKARLSTVAGLMVLVMMVSIAGTLWYADRHFGLSLFSRKFSSLKEGEGLVTSYGMMPPDSSGAESARRAELSDSVPGILKQAQGVSPVAGDHYVIRKAQISIEVSRGQARSVFGQGCQVIEAHSGYVESSSLSESGQPGKERTTFYLVARVPSREFGAILEELSGLGKLLKQDTQAQDVTDEYIDLDARLRNKENEEHRLLQILGEARTVGELLQVEGELSRIRGDIESMRGRKMFFDRAISMSSVSLDVSEEGAKPNTPSPWKDVWQAFIRAWTDLLMVVAKVTPTLILVGALLFLGLRVLRKA